MNHKQKLGYMALGAGVLAIGIIIGQVIQHRTLRRNRMACLMKFNVPGSLWLISRGMWRFC